MTLSERVRKEIEALFVAQDSSGNWIAQEKVALSREQITRIAILAAEEERKACAEVCGQIAAKHWDTYKVGTGPGWKDPHMEGKADGADECERAIEARGKA